MKINRSRILVGFGIYGLFFPVGWKAADGILGSVEPRILSLIYNSNWFDAFFIFLWPSSLILIADPLDNNYLLQVSSIAINIIYFLILGAISSYVLKVNKLAIMIPVFFHMCVFFYLYRGIN